MRRLLLLAGSVLALITAIEYERHAMYTTIGKFGIAAAACAVVGALLSPRQRA